MPPPEPPRGGTARSNGGTPRATPLLSRHRAAGAHLGEFAGWLLPLWFAGTTREHTAVRQRSGCFDVSHLGALRVSGPDAGALVARTFTNDPGRLTDGRAQYTLLCDDDGGVLDDLLVYRLGPERWWCVPNAANTTTVLDALRDGARGLGARVQDATDDWAVLAVQGPDSLALVDAVLAGASAPAVDLAPFDVVEVGSPGRRVVVARTGYTGEPGVELLVEAAEAPELWDRLTGAGAEPCGLGARDSLRLEQGYPLHGSDLGPWCTPFDAGLGWAVRFGRGAFRGCEALWALRDTPRRRWGLRLAGRRPPRAGMAVLRDGHRVGVITSGGWSPTLEAGIALADLDPPLGPDSDVAVDVRGREVPALVVRPPFLTR